MIRLLWLISGTLFVAAASVSAQDAIGSHVPNGALSAAVASTQPDPIGNGACEPSGKGTDYQVGTDKKYRELADVPWEKLKAGDTVRIFYRDAPYRGKFLIAGRGTVSAPLRVCGVKSASGQRPIIDGVAAPTREQLADAYGNSNEASGTHQARAIIEIKSLASQAWTAYPAHIQIDGLAIRNAYFDYSFIDADGQVKKYDKFAAGIWLDRGQDISILDNEISNCGMAIFSRSTDDGDFALTKNVRIAGNTFQGNGVPNDWYEHTLYIQSVGVTLEFNRFGSMRSGASGNQYKDRSVGSVIRYNYFEGGAHSLDLVEAEDFYPYVASDPAYRLAYVYGNIFVNDEKARAIVHYGGDHFGSNRGDKWGESIFRKGTLYFFNNTVLGRGQNGRIFRISTTDETVEAWNNIFYFEGTVSLRTTENDSVGAAWTRDGVLKLGRNWISKEWGLGDKQLQGQVIGTDNLVSSKGLPFDLKSFFPAAGTGVVDVADGEKAISLNHSPVWQLSLEGKPVKRNVNGRAMDFGAVER